MYIQVFYVYLQILNVSRFWLYAYPLQMLFNSECIQQSYDPLAV